MPPYVKEASTIVETLAQVGDGTRIGHFSHVANGARIGSGCTIGQGVSVAGTAVIGAGATVANNVSICDGVVIETYAFIGPGVVFTNVNRPRSEVEAKLEEAIRVGRGATVGANVTVLPGIAIGPYAFVGAGAVVTANVPAFALIFGTPARQRAWVCRCGQQLSLESGVGYCSGCSRTYRLSGSALCEA